MLAQPSCTGVNILKTRTKDSKATKIEKEIIKPYPYLLSSS
jgi:hypothetical protein